MRTLGIDHGERRVGLALSDEDGRIAHPHATLARRDPKELITAVAEVVTREGVQAIVVGLPLHLDGREGASARRARRFAQHLEQATGLAITLWDERLTTIAAERALGEGGVRVKDQRQMVDRVAAALMLQSYLDARQGAVRAPEPEGDDEPWAASERAPEELPEPDGAEPRRGSTRRGGRSRGR
jgi:putative Holliday junction resolvase